MKNLAQPHPPGLSHNIFQIAVRYAWADNPHCNLYNTAGLPASPFRTDDIPEVTFSIRQT